MTDPEAEKWLEKNHKILFKMAKARHRDPAAMISHLTFWLDINFNKISQIPDHDGQMKFCQAWMKNQSKWRRSTVNLDVNLGKIDLGDSDEYFRDIQNKSDQVESPDEILMSAEPGELGGMAKVILDWQRIWSDLEIQKIMTVKLIIKEQLDESEKIFMQMYITNSQSLRQIAEKTRLPLSAVWSILQKIKLKIKNALKDDRYNF